MTNIIKNIVTFGAQGRIDKAIKRYEQAVEERNNAYQDLKNIHHVAVKKSMELQKVQKKSLKSIGRLKLLFDKFNIKDRELIGFHVTNNIVMKDNNNISLRSDVAEFTGKDMFSTASKGAITAAASSTSLLFMDTAAMSTGIAASVVALPVIVALGAFSHIKASKKISEIQEYQEIAIKQLEKIKGEHLKCQSAIKRCEELSYVIKNDLRIFDRLYSEAYRSLYPIPIISRIIRRTGMPLTKKQQEKISLAAFAAKKVTSIIDQAKD